MTKQILLTLLNCSWQWGLLGGMTWLITRRFRQANSTTHLLWLLFLLSLPILFALNQFVPALSIGNTTTELSQTLPIKISGFASQDVDLSAMASTESATQSHTPMATANEYVYNWSISDLILCIWAIGTLAMLIRMVFGLYRIRRLRSTATVAEGPYQAICKRLAQDLNIKRPVTVCFSDLVTSPISFGWLSPYILIPRNLTLDQFELVAAHELAHVQRLDWLTNLISHLVGAIFFFHPIYHILNRKLVHLRERICDDWVIRLTGARKNYAQCLLDLVRRENKVIPLALTLNQPSQLGSRIDSILKHNRRLDLQPKPRLLMLATFLLLTCLPLLSMAQLIPLKTFHLSLFSQTSQESKQADDVEKNKNSKQIKMMEKKDKKEYKEDASIQVLDPAGFNKSKEKRIYSGPQPGEKLPALKAIPLYSKNQGKILDITSETGGKTVILFLQDNNAVGIKGLDKSVRLLSRIGNFHKKQVDESDTNTSNKELQIGVVFLLDDAKELPEWSDEFLQGLLKYGVMVGVSPDGREGPGVYGMNRNVAQTILIAKDGKVLHNFAFTQPMLYTDPYVLGAVARAIEVEPAALEKWLNEKAAKHDKNQDMDEKSAEYYFSEIKKALMNGKISREEAAEKLKEVGITWEEGEKLLKNTKDTSQKMVRERRYDNQRQVRIADPADFKTPENKQVFSGPQPGEKLPPMKATSIVGESEGKTFDFTKTDGQPLVLFLQDENGVGFRSLYDTSRMIAKIASESKQELHISVIFLADDSGALKQKVSGVARGVAQNVSKNILLGLSPDGREGPGNYGLNRNVSQTIIIAKDGKVLHNFVFTQPTVYADPYVLGAIVQAIGVDPASVEKWLNEAPAEDKRMQRDSRQMEPEGARNRENTPSREELIRRFDKDGDGKLNREEGMAARRALANQENQNRNRSRTVDVRNPAEFKKTQEKKIFSGPQPGEKLPPLFAEVINGEDKEKTYDFIAKADGQPLVLFLQDETPLGLRGLVGFMRLLAQIADKSKQQFNINVVFLGDDPDTLAKQASRIVPHVPSGVLLGLSPDGREGPGSYGLNRSVAQTILIVKDGKVLHNFALTQPMLSPDPYVLGAVGELIGEKPATLVKWLNRRTPTIEIKNPTETEKDGKILLNDVDVEIDELLSLLINLPKAQKALLTIQAGQEVLHGQIVKVMDIAKEAGIKKIGFGIINPAKDKSMKSDKAQKQRSKDSD